MKKEDLAPEKRKALSRILKKQTAIVPYRGLAVVRLGQVLRALSEAYDAGALAAIDRAGDALDQGDQLQDLLARTWAGGGDPSIILDKNAET